MRVLALEHLLGHRVRERGPDARRSASARASGTHCLRRDDRSNEADAVAPRRRR